MALNKPVRRIAIVGTGVIGASWAAEFLAHGFDVVATDPAPNAEQNLRKYIDAAWPALTAKGLEKNASRERLTFSLDLKEAVSRADLVQENGTAGFQDQIVRRDRRGYTDRFDHCVQLLGDHDERDAVRVCAPGAVRHRTSF